MIESLVGKHFLLTEEQRAEQHDIFLEYIESQTETPDFWSDTESDTIKNRLRCPPEWHLVLSLLRHGLCQSEDEAWDYPYSRAVCWRAVIGEQVEGSQSYVDPLDRQQMEIVNNGNHH